jgi:hypothetical protein
VKTAPGEPLPSKVAVMLGLDSLSKGRNFTTLLLAWSHTKVAVTN